MTKKITVTNIILALFFLVACNTIFAAPPGCIAGQAIVQLKNGQSPNAILNRYKVDLIDSIPNTNTILVGYDTNLSVDSMVNTLTADEDVMEATANIEVILPEVHQISQGFPDENRPVFNLGIEPINYYDQEAVYNTGIDSAQIITTGEGVTIAVIDNGLVMDHPLISTSVILPGHDFIDKDIYPYEEDGYLYGHGTFVTGIILLTAPDVQILPIRAFNCDGVGDQFAVAQSIYWAVEQGADIINMSFGSVDHTNILDNAINEAIHNDISLVASAGNDSTETVYYPAAYPEVIAVTALDQNELRAPFSNYGDHIDIAAPGVHVYSALPGEYLWGTWSGTSFSAPFVTGAVAFIKQLDNNLSPSEIEEHLHMTSRTDLLWGSISVPNDEYGYGALDAFEAVVQLSIGDANGDGNRDISDFVIMIEHFGNNGQNGNDYNTSDFEHAVRERQFDLNCDGITNMHDIAIMRKHLFKEAGNFNPCYQR